MESSKEMFRTEPACAPVQISFRFAGRKGCAIILRFIRELAKYEHLEADVVATEELLEKWLFDKNTAQVLFAIVGDQEVGFALFFSSFSTFLSRAGMYLEDIFVLLEYRGRGIGTAIFRKLANIAVECGYGRFEWVCLDWNTLSIEFYHALGTEPVNGWTTFRLAGYSLIGLA